MNTKAAMPAYPEWRPIESAPKTSHAILIYVPENFCTYAATWSDSDDEWKGWLVFGGGWRDHLQRASHWMPLPEPPALSDQPTRQEDAA